MKFDKNAILQQIKQHQIVIDDLERQRAGIIGSISKLKEEVDKLKEILKTIDSLEI